MSKLSTLLREAREAKGWTQAELAERSKVPIQTISRYEKPRWTGSPDIANVIRLAHDLEISDDDWMPAIGLPTRRSKSPEEREARWADIVALAENDTRFQIFAEMWKAGTDEEKDDALNVSEVVFKRKRRPVTRRRLRDDQ